MSESTYNLMADIAGRCGIKNERVLRKSKELLGILNSKRGVLCSDTCKAVVCLEIASSLTSSCFSREEAVKYSGCKKKNYTNNYNIISKLLNLDKIYSVKEICLLFGVSDIQEQAQKLLQKYKNSCDGTECDYEHPVYPSAAVLAVCRSNKIKVNMTKLVEISRVKKIELDELAKKFQDLLNIKQDDKNSEKKPSKISNHCETSSVTEIDVTPRKKSTTSGIMTDEEYEAWKKKMLE